MLVDRKDIKAVCAAYLPFSSDGDPLSIHLSRAFLSFFLNQLIN